MTCKYELGPGVVGMENQMGKTVRGQGCLPENEPLSELKVKGYGIGGYV